MELCLSVAQLGRTDFFTMVTLPVHEHSMPLHLYKFLSSMLCSFQHCYAFPAKFICQSPNPNTLKHDLTWRFDLYRGNQVKLRSLGYI